ncbi:MAG: nitroreductase family deazaflavin-dependent oxidoreductase [Proteobacteria bacterium]|nr:nitroreductase family deazaflavin-dependent oxidoreductase [Pseudomonadota bacterium]
MTDFNTGIIDEFRENKGKVGGMFEGAPLLILHTKGAKTGADREAPLMYLPLDGRMFVFASKAGATTHPDWYHNAVANPAVEVELGDATMAKTAVELDRTERDVIYAEQASRYPQFAQYEETTGDRVIPVLELV